MDHEISPLRQMAAHMIKAPKMFSGGNPESLESYYHGVLATLSCCLGTLDYRDLLQQSRYVYNEKVARLGKTLYYSTLSLASQGANEEQINEICNPVLLRLIEKYETVLKTQEKNP